MGINVSIETFMTALSNPDSVLYTRSLHGKHILSSAYYGTVCSEFVSYVFEMPFHIDCQQWPFLPGISEVDSKSLENLKLCDIILDRERHVAIITGINRDERGSVVDITVTESNPPRVISTVFTPTEFREYWLKNNYEVLRYSKTNGITYSPDPFVQLSDDPILPLPDVNSIIMSDYGNKANYLEGETVMLSVFDPTFTDVDVIYNGVKTRFVVEGGKVSFTPDKVGYYKAVAVSGAKESKAVEFCVVNATVTTDKKNYNEGDEVVPSFFCEGEDELRGWVVKTDKYAKYWGYPIDDNGDIPRGAKLPNGKYLVIALYRNKFGVYSSKPHFFDVGK